MTVDSFFGTLPHPLLNDENAAQWVQAAVAQARLYRPPRLVGRGIVIPGGGRYTASTYVAVRTLRHFGCKLPIQIWHLGADEMPPRAREIFQGEGVLLSDARAHPAAHTHKRLNGWEVKAFALLHCPWREVLLLDADNLPLRDVTNVFDEPLYKQHGSLFWPDRGRWHATHPIWKLTGLPYRDEAEFESGQIVVDRQRCWQELVLANWFNHESAFWYGRIHGDKDTFRLAWRSLGTDYGMIPHKNTGPWLLAYQHDSAQQLLFHHGVKWDVKPTKNKKLLHVPDICYSFLDEFAARIKPQTINDALAAPQFRWAAQYGEDRWLALNVPLPDRGVFIEVGASHSIDNSNTYWLEELGWTGLLIEADERNIVELSAARSSPVLHCAAANHDGDLTFVQHSNRTWSGARRQESDGQLVTVPARRLDSICQERGITSIDVLSVDTEGTEVDVLDGLGTLRPSIIIAEFLTEGLANTDVDLRAKLHGMGYNIAHTTHCNIIATLAAP